MPMLEVASRRLLRRATLDDGDRTRRLTVFALLLLGTSVHAAQVFLFLQQGLSWGTWPNIGSVLFYGVSFLLLRSGRVLPAIAVAGTELWLFVNGMTFATGVQAGYSYYFLVIFVAGLIVFRYDEVRYRNLWLGWFATTGVAVYYLAWWSPNPLALSRDFSTTIAAFNLAGSVLSLLIAIAYFSWFSTKAEASALAERARSDALLLNVLPESIAKRLKDEDAGIADRYESVTVLFSDIVGFTKLSARISTEKLISILNDIFTRFDNLAEKHGLEKIKTIGDAYMVVGGAPTPRPDHADAVARMALDMRDAIADFARSSDEPIDIRIGLHTGPVVAGVIGVKKFAYDLWGDTVNTASRMESHGEAGRIQISADTKAALSDGFTLTPRGTIEVKGKGPMQTYFLDAAPPES